MPRTGRPKMYDTNKDKHFATRVTQETLDKLQYCADAENVSRTVALERAIDKSYQELIQKETD